MGDTIVFECRECGETGRIDSTSLNFITSATELTRGEAMLCDEHLSETVGGVTFDLGIGSGHTADDEFRSQQEQRKAEKNADEIAEKQAAEYIEIGPRYSADDTGRVEVQMPPVAKHHLKQTTRSVTGYDYRHDRSAWTIVDTEPAIAEVTTTLRDAGWDVRVTVETDADAP